MNDLFLGLIAGATVTMALVQIGAAIYAGRAARRVEHLLLHLEQELKPVIARVTSMAGDAARVASLGASQAERIDALLTDLSYQVSEGVTQVRQAVVSPARQGMALVSGIRAAIAILRQLDVRRGSRRPDDEDALFIG